MEALKLAILSVVLALCLVLARGGYVLEIQAHRYDNSDHMLANGQCCDNELASSNCLTFPATILCGFSCECDLRFFFCLREAGTLHDDHTGNCALGFYQTTQISTDDDTFDFSFPYIDHGVPNPMTFTGDVWHGSFQLYTEAFDVDLIIIDIDSHVDDIYVERSLNPSSSFTAEQWYPGDHGSRIRLSFRVQCTADFYGSNCTIFCMAQDDSGGHYTCGNSGERVCLSGWSDPNGNCLTPVCAAGCHPIGGSCSLPGECNCNSGWTGSSCDQCIPRTGCSSEGGYCNEPNECICHQGYAGEHCEVDLLRCQRDAPCQNGGTCTNDGLGGYLCSCTPGWVGINCDVEDDNSSVCIPSPCRNGGTCNELLSGFSCDCVAGFEGEQCEISQLGGCTPFPCENGGTCTEVINGYSCECEPGWTGQRCEENIYDCEDAPCQNEGTCFDLVDDYWCVCPRGWEGRNCAVETDECAGNPCVQGECDDHFDDYFCRCTEGYFGRNCELEIDECLPRPCENEGECVDLVADFRCDCLPDYTGKECDVYLASCSSSPCLNQATCTNLPNSFNCSCAPGYMGANCADLIESNPSSVRGDQDKTPFIGGAVAGVVIILIILLVIIAGVLYWKKKKNISPPLSQPEGQANPTYEDISGIISPHATSREVPQYMNVKPDEEWYYNATMDIANAGAASKPTVNYNPYTYY